MEKLKSFIVKLSERLKFSLGLIKETFSIFLEAKPFNYSASIAFYTIFSMPAILLIILFVAGTTFDSAMVQSELFSHIKTIIGAENTEQVREVMENARLSGAPSWMNAVGIGLLLFSATTVFVALQDSLNELWHVKPKPKNVFIKFVFDRLLSFGIVVSFGFIMLIFLIIDTLLAVLRNYIATQFPDFLLAAIEVINFALSAFIVMIIFSLIFKILPDTRLQWKQVWPGALLTTVLFIAGKFVINFYLQHTQFTTTYGVAGSLVAILLWIYFSCLLLFLGAAFVKAYATKTDNVIRPAKHAVNIAVKEVERHQQE